MLEYQQTVMDAREWSATVFRIASSIDSHPEQYLGRDLPNHDVTSRVIKEIFDDFVQGHPHVTEDALLVH